MPISAQSAQDLDGLHDRIGQVHNVLKDLRHKIARLDGRQLGGDDDDVNALLDTTTTTTLPLAAVDPEAEELLSADISDRLRDVRSDYDLLVEDAQDLGWLVSREDVQAKGHSDGDDDDNEDASAPHRTSAAVERARLAKALARTDRAMAQTRRVFRAVRTRGLLRKPYALRDKVFQELATYDTDCVSDSSCDEEEEEDDSNNDDDGDYDAHAEKKHLSNTHHPHQSAEASAAAELTAALRQTHARIVGEVTRSDFAAQTLEESSRALAELGDRYSSSSTGVGDINSGLRAARSMVRGLLVAQKSDTWYLQMSVYVLASTVTWLLFRRLLYGPLWLLVWWPVRSAFGTAVWVGKTGASVGAAAGMGGGGGGAGSSSMMMMVSVPAADVRFSSSSVVPSASTGTVPAEAYTTAGSASSSLVEQVGRVVDEAATAMSASVSASVSASASTAEVEGEQSSEAPAATDAPNPMKRMWEEDVEAAKYEEQQRQEKAAQDAEKAQQAEAAAAEAETAKDEDKGKGKEATSEKDEL